MIAIDILTFPAPIGNIVAVSPSGDISAAGGNLTHRGTQMLR